MGDLRPLREIAAEAVERYRQKKCGLTMTEAQAFEEARRRTVAAAIQMEDLITRDREFLKRLGIRV